MIGGISYFHEFAYDLLAENERILAATFDAAIARAQRGHLEKIVVISSSMVYETATVFPTPEGAQLTPPAAGLHVRLPEARQPNTSRRAPRAVQAAVHDRPPVQLRRHRRAPGGARHGSHERQRQAGHEHVVPDLVHKVLKGQDPLHILGDGNQVRHYTYGGDLARGIRLAWNRRAAVNDDFNLSTAATTTVLELARGDLAQGQRPRRARFAIVSDPPFEHDVQTPRPGRPQGARGPRLRGDDDA